MILAIGSDHGGFELKEEVKKHLEARGVEYKDFGCFSKDSVDYPLVAKEVGTQRMYHHNALFEQLCQWR